MNQIATALISEEKTRVQNYIIIYTDSPWFFHLSNPESNDSAFHQKAIQNSNMHLYVQSEIGGWAVYIYRNLNTLEKKSKNRAILNRKHASSFVIVINIVGWTLKFYTFQLINKTQNILKGLYIVSSQHCALCVSMNFMTKSQWQLFIHKQIMYLWWLYIFDNNYTNFKTFCKYS